MRNILPMILLLVPSLAQAQSDAAPVATGVTSGASTNTPSTTLGSTVKPPPVNFVGVNIMGFAGFLRLNIGSFELHYERVFAHHHGLQIAGDFIHVHQNAESVQSHQWTFGGSLTYRYYMGDTGGAFVGLNLGYRRGWGHFEEPNLTSHTALENEQFRALAQFGYRIVIPQVYLSIVPRVGLGYGAYRVTAVGAVDESMRARAEKISHDNLAAQPLVMEFELSISSAF